MKSSTAKEKLTNRFTFRMTDEETALLEKAAKALNCRPSEAARLAMSALALATKEVTAV